MYNILFIFPPTNGYLGFFVNNAVKNFRIEGCFFFFLYEHTLKKYNSTDTFVTGTGNGKRMTFVFLSKGS